MTDRDRKVTLSEGADLVGLTRQTLWEWAKKGWIKPLKNVSKTGGRPAQVFSAIEVINVTEERGLISADEAIELRKKLKSNKVDKGDKGDNNR